MTGQAAIVMASLRRARMVLLSLALMAGIFGMHVMAVGPIGGHGTTAEAASDHGVAASAEGSEHPDHAGPSGGTSAHDHAGPQRPDRALDEACTGPHGCAGMHSMDPTCTPAAKSASLEAPLPGNGTAVASPPSGKPLPAANRFHRPESPSPGDLCISRT